MARTQYVELAYAIGANGRPYNPNNMARLYGSEDCVRAVSVLWSAWFDKHMLGGRAWAPEVWADRAAMEAKAMAIQQADRNLNPVLWAPECWEECNHPTCKMDNCTYRHTYGK